MVNYGTVKRQAGAEVGNFDKYILVVLSFEECRYGKIYWLTIKTIECLCHRFVVLIVAP